MKLVDQWRSIEDALPAGWEDVRITLTTDNPADLRRAAHVLGSIGAGRLGSSLVFHVRRAGGSHGPQAARCLLECLDRDPTLCRLEQSQVQVAAPTLAAEAAPLTNAVAESWDAALAPLPADWTDLLCELELESSDCLARAALLCAPLNPTRDASRLAFTFRCSGRLGYGASRSMARRCLERLDGGCIAGSVRVLRVLSDTDNVDTQGPVWLVGGKSL